MVTMRRLLPLILSMIMLSFSLCANEHYLLPEEKSDLIHSLKRKIERAESITIITSSLDSPSLSKSIEKALKQEARFQLITTDIPSAAYYAKYKNTTIKVPVSQRLADNFHLNILLIDQSDVCFSTLSFSDTDLKRGIGEVTCTTNSEEITFALDIKRRFTERFEDYSH